MEKYGHLGEEKLLDSLIEVMSDREKCFPDPQLEAQGGQGEGGKKFSSILVDFEGYGTRDEFHETFLTILLLQRTSVNIG